MAVFQVVHKMTLLQQEVRNIYYYETITGNPSASEWQDICDEIRSDFATTIGASTFSNNWKFWGIDYRQVDTAGLPSFSVLPTSGDLDGTNANDDLPTQIALLVTAKANVTKPNRVRTYYCGFTEENTTDGLWGATIRGLVEDFFDDQTVLNAAGTNELQRVSAQWNTGHTAVVAYNNVAAAPGKASEVPATQRRRRIGVGM